MYQLFVLKKKPGGERGQIHVKEKRCEFIDFNIYIYIKHDLSALAGILVRRTKLAK